MGANQNSSPVTWLVSQIKPDTPLFLHGQDHIAIDKLLVLETGLDNLETQWKMTHDASKATCEIMGTKNEP
jgi:hypothetical protein